MSEAGFPRESAFKVSVRWDGSTGGHVEFQDHPDLRFDIPRSFGGPGAGYCPEELFVASIASCLTTTFAYLRPKLRLDARSLRVEGVSRVAFVDGAYKVVGVELRVRVEVAEGQAELAKRCLELASEYCHITRSIKSCVPVSVDLEVVESNR